MTIDMTAEDLSRTYGDTYIGMREDGVILPTYVIGSSHRNRIDVRVYKKDEQEESRININDPSLVLTYPDSGAFNVREGNAAFVSRQAQRQWRRGISVRHLTIIGDISFDHNLVRGMFNPTYTPHSQALERARKESKYSAALDRNFWLRTMPMYMNPIIMFRNTCIGEYKDKKGPVIKNKALAYLFEECINENP